MTLKVFRSKNGKTIRLNIQVNISKEFFKNVVKNFLASFPEHHFMVITMTARGFLNGWHRLTKESDC